MKKIILASKSPRRIEMLKKYKIQMEIIPSDIIEVINSNDSPETIVMSLAFQKAEDISHKCNENCLVIAADTIVYLNEILGKPSDRDDGYKMLKLLSNRIHYVYSGICIIDCKDNKKIIDYEETKVEFKKLSENTIKSYLDTNEYVDKAGAYGIQGYGELLVKNIVGCYNNVKGLPISRLNELLIKHFNYNLLNYSYCRNGC